MTIYDLVKEVSGLKSTDAIHRLATVVNEVCNQTGINPNEYVVRRIMKLRKQGKSTNAIAKLLGGLKR